MFEYSNPAAQGVEHSPKRRTQHAQAAIKNEAKREGA